MCASGESMLCCTAGMMLTVTWPMHGTPIVASGGSHCTVCPSCSWGTFWGELGFFRLARGENTFWIEEGDCWYAKPTFEMEEDVREGKLSGSMYGLIDKKRSLDITKLSTA